MPHYPNWTPEEHDLLYLETRLKTPLLELESILKRPHNGILQKMQNLSKYLPHLYHPELIKWYQRQFHKLHHDQFLKFGRTYRQVHAEELKKMNRERYNPKKKRKYYLTHREEISKYLSAWKLKRQRKFIISCLKQRIDNLQYAKVKNLETVLESVEV